MAQVDDFSPLANAIALAFAPYLEESNSGSAEAVASAAPFAMVDSSARELVIDTTSILCGILTAGENSKRRANSAAWTVDWLRKNNKRISLVNDRMKLVIGAVNNNFEPVISRTLRYAILPNALELSKSTSGKDKAELRHLVIAILTSQEARYHISALVNPGLSGEEHEELVQYVISCISANAPDGESLEAWNAVAKSRDRAPPKSNSTNPRAPVAPLRTESLPTHGDHPATVDTLGRKAFAQVLAQRMRSAREEAVKVADFGAFIAHIHGPWGHGKTSALNFLRNELLLGDDPWLVVDFNAWKHNRLRPPWWSLISAIYDAARKAADVPGNWKRRRVWLWWKLRSDAPKYLAYLAVPIGLLLLGLGVFTTTSETLKGIAGAITAVGLVVGTIRTLSFGSDKAANAYAEMKIDPYGPIVELYSALIKSTECPVAIFIDDLDRCDSAYVVELIEGIQTLLRTEPVVFVIAADRKWICSAFEKKYADFAGPISEPARPLGYLFLDKLFQISAALPMLSREARDGYWKSLLDSAPGKAAPPPLAPEDAEALVRGKGSIEALQKVIADAPEAHRTALRAAAAVEITRAENAETIEHSLQPFAELLEPNPRAMKRLVNAVGMAQARAFIEARAVPLETLARWTMIELRWPLLADYLADNVDLVAHAGLDAAAAQAAGAPANIAAMLADARLRDIVGPDGGRYLDAQRLSALLG